MSTSSVALAGRHRRKSSGKAISHTLFGGAAVACLVIGCGWTVYSNIINASAAMNEASKVVLIFASLCFRAETTRDYTRSMLHSMDYRVDR